MTEEQNAVINLKVAKINRLLAKGCSPDAPDIVECIKIIERAGGKFELLTPDKPKVDVAPESNTNGRKTKKILPQTNENGIDVAPDAGSGNSEESI